MLTVLDTDVLAAAAISARGASRQWLAAVLRGEATPLISVPLAFEYESVLKRPDILARAGAKVSTIDRLLDAVMGAAQFVEIAYLWRPSLRDPGDEMVLETAVNGHADWLITFNVRDFLGAARFGIKVEQPGPLWRQLRRSRDR